MNTESEEKKRCMNCEHVNVINEEEPCASCFLHGNWEPRLADQILAVLIFKGKKSPGICEKCKYLENEWLVTFKNMRILDYSNAGAVDWYYNGKMKPEIDIVEQTDNVQCGNSYKYKKDKQECDGFVKK